MRKIKRFKISVHHKEIARRIRKAGLDLPSAGIPDDIAFREFVAGLASGMEPAVVFDSFPSGSDEWKHITSMPGLAFSAGVVTLGAAVEEKLRPLHATEPAVAAKVALRVFLEDAVSFVLDLIQEEASREGLELGPIEYLALPPADPYTSVLSDKAKSARPCEKNQNAGDSRPETLSALTRRLEASKIGVEWDCGNLRPEHTALFSVPWLSKRKSRSSR